MYRTVRPVVEETALPIRRAKVDPRFRCITLQGGSLPSGFRLETGKNTDAKRGVD
jgi:hypothetical protein